MAQYPPEQYVDSSKYPAPQGHAPQPGHAPAPGYPPQQGYPPQYPPQYPQQKPGSPPQYPPPNPMAAPAMQAMDGDLTRHDAIVVRQFTQWKEVIAQAMGIDYEQANKYKISPVPQGLRAATSPNDPKRWKPTADELQNMPQMMFAKEKSECMTRCCFAVMGCLNKRPFEMHYTDNAGFERIRLERPFKCGAWCGCPVMLTVKEGPRTLGVVEEDCDPCFGRCVDQCCFCTFYTRVLEARPDGGLEHRYTIVAPVACCGRVNNCCGATCCKDSMVFDIQDAQGTLIGHIQKLYAAGGVGACCRMVNNLNNYVLDFPPGSTAPQRSLLMGGLMHVNYMLCEKTGAENNGGGGGP